MSVGDKPKKTTVAQKQTLKETREEKLNKVKEQDKKTKIVNTGRSANGTLLKGDLAELNEKFRGDQFKAENSFNNSVSEPKRSKLVEANSKMTCPLNANLGGKYSSNDDFSKNVSDADKKELSDLRKSVPPITNTTVMQKAIPIQTVEGYENKGWSTVKNCCSKAEDTAPYTGNADGVYCNLRLDYEGGGEQYKDLAENGGDVYIMRFTSDTCPDNSALPNSTNGNGPPCTETGLLGGSDYLIPETMYPDAQISDGVIYKVDKDGNESMEAAWNGKCFQSID